MLLLVGPVLSPYPVPMRRHSVIEDSREKILAELEEYRSDRADGPHPRPEKAAPYAQAMHAIEAGAVEVRVDHVVYRVVGEQRPRQYVTVERDRERILSELRGYSDSLGTRGYGDAATAVERGALAVWADGVLYRVVED